MNHLNLFNTFESRDPHHEDVLTRNFLILLKNIPLVQVGFFELIRDTMSSKGVEIESSARGILKLSEIYTQVDNKDSMFKNMTDVNMLSIIISDDAFKTEHSVSASNRQARYDGVVICEPSWVFIIENKPSVHNIWAEQMNPNINNAQKVNLIAEPCALSWRDIISLLNELLSSDSLVLFEHTAISEFIEYVDENYSWLNPYYKFELCKSDSYLLNRRCCAIMETYKDNVEVKYHKSWKHYIDIGSDFVHEIALDSHVETNNNWNINLWMYAADTMSIARSSYSCLNVEKLFDLPKIDSGFSISSNFHYSFMSTGKLWTDCPVSVEEYINYWIKNRDIKQLKRKDFVSHFDTLVKNGIVSEANRNSFNDIILSKGYQTLNICPGFLIKYTWTKRQAILLDNQKAFEEDFRNKVKMILNVFEK